MQQVQDKPQIKAQPQAKPEQASAYQPSAWSAVLATSAKVCYGLSAASAVASVGVWNRGLLVRALSKKSSKRRFAKASAKPSKSQFRKTVKATAYVGAFAPVFAAAGKALDYANEQVHKNDYAKWEKQQASKARAFARFFSR